MKRGESRFKQNESAGDLLMIPMSKPISFLVNLVSRDCLNQLRFEPRFLYRDETQFDSLSELRLLSLFSGLNNTITVGWERDLFRVSPSPRPIPPITDLFSDLLGRSLHSYGI